MLIVSFHDLHPGSWDCCRRFIETSRKLGARHMTLLIVPQFHGQEPFTENEPFVQWLRNLPVDEFDFCLHGYYHKAENIRGNWYHKLMGKVYTTGEGEFYQLSQIEAQEKLSAGMNLFNSSRLPVYGFTAPAWLISPEGKSAIRESGFLYNTLWDKVELPTSNIAVKAPTIVYSSRNLWRRFVSKLWVSFFQTYTKNAHILRLAVHPIDFEFPDIEAHIYRVLEKALRTRTTSTYRDLVPAEKLRPVSLATD